MTIPGTWSQAFGVALIVLIIAGIAVTIALRPRRRRNRRIARRPVPQTAEIYDFYEEKRARMVKWLGDDYLLAKPINRRPSPPLE